MIATAAFGAPTHYFAIDGPATGNLGEPFNFTVTAMDEGGNPTPDYTGTVTFLGNSGITVPSNYTFTPADAGTKTFTGTPTRGGYVYFGVKDAAPPPDISGNHSMQITCPGFTVTASNDGPVCAGQVPTLTASTAETGVTFNWWGPRFWGGNGPVVPGRADYEGTYFVSITAANGCNTFTSTTVTLKSAVPEVRRVVANPHWICDETEKTYALLDNALNSPYSDIVWHVSGPGTIVSGQGTTQVTVAGNYDENGPKDQSLSLWATATTAGGCATVSPDAEGGIHVYQRPVATIETPATACPGTELVARAVLAPTVTNPATYLWSIENGDITDGLAGEMKYTVSGGEPAVITLTVTDYACSYTTTATVSAGPSATIASASHDLCAGESVQIPVTLAGQAPFTIGWSDGALQTGVGSSFTRTVTPDGPTSYTIISVSDANCNGGTSAGSIEVTTRNDAVITQQPVSTKVDRGARATLKVDVEPEATAVQWYRGLRGDQSNPVSGATSLQFITPPITQNTTFWAEIQTSCGTVASNTATVTLSSSFMRRRAVGHP